MYCGDTYALAATGLWRLDAPSTGIAGTWTMVLDPGQLGFYGVGPSDLDKGVLRVADDPRELQVMSGFGAFSVVNTSGTCMP
jgi:hypothetical protein